MKGNMVGRVRCIPSNDTRTGMALKNGALCDIAPTILELVGLDQPGRKDGKPVIDAVNTES